ncbi:MULTISPECIES: SDR family NAD(P)-dependent oxidoreductase [unclassified Brevibacterium]|uniref:SDR family NAD(P)-dependent oxidoreductase n=1 Tax=unclassified Brevibacterium TaxID=2614124 RepID=UPI0010C7AD9E|nr:MULTISPECIES: SDR family oxidoreductase [unclassified Brevibacterium]MCK1802059.1 SDR family oxidoreductase [Brevibacterium sp. R8603A2]QCP06252.1 SDR family oxidoreductase [Brevibacterium sp. CS2]
MDLSLANSAYIVTGGTSGLGLATAQALISEGARVLVSSRNQEKVDAAVAELGDGSHGIALDNASPEAPATLFRTAAEAFPDSPVRGLMISVGGPKKGRFFETTEDDWRAALDSVLLGTLRLARYAGEHLGPGSAIGMVLSSSVWTPVPDIAISNGLRPGLGMMVKTLSDELGPRDIRVVGVAPGIIRTPRVGSAEVPTDHIPLRRLGTPEEFGRVAAFLLSPAAAYVTGSVIPVDGGMIRAL